MRKMVNIAWVLANFELMDATINDEPRASVLCRKVRDVLNCPEFMDSIRTHGVAAPVALDLTNKVFYNGLHRLLACWLLDITHIPYVEVIDEDAETLLTAYGIETEYVRKGFPVCKENK